MPELRHLQITSFVSPEGDSPNERCRGIGFEVVGKYPDADLFALVPNLRGAEAAWESGLRAVSYVVSLSESHNKANIRRTHEESFCRPAGDSGGLSGDGCLLGSVHHVRLPV